MKNKNLKKALKIWTIGSLMIGAAGVGYYYYKKSNSEQYLKDLVMEVWESENVRRSVYSLDLKQTPDIVFTKLDSSAVMQVKYSYYTRLFTITKTIPEYRIYIDIDNLYGQIASIQYATFNFGKSLQKSIIKMLLLHECKHIEQAQGNFHVGNSTMEFDSILGHGNKPCEKDANEFALSQAGAEEYYLFLLLKTQEEESGSLSLFPRRDMIGLLEAVKNDYPSRFAIIRKNIADLLA